MQFHDIGKLMLAFVMLFAYFSFSQWLIIWAGNLPEEIGWYPEPHSRWLGHGALIIMLFHFALPFALLAVARTQRAGSRLIGLACLMFMRMVDIYWYVVPNFAPTDTSTSASGTWWPRSAMGGLWLAYFFYNLRQRPIVAAYEPQMPKFVAQGVGTWHTNDTITILYGNPQVDYEHADLSARGILMFLIGLLVCRLLIELVIWGMFRFMAQDDVLFPADTESAMTAQTDMPDTTTRSALQKLRRTPFPEAAAADRRRRRHEQVLNAETRTLDPEQPFTDRQRRGAYSDFPGDEAGGEAWLAGAPSAPPAQLIPGAESGNRRS